MSSLKLPFHEWCIILLFCAILLSLAGFVVLDRSGSSAAISVCAISSPSAPQDPCLQVRVEGCVAHPGVYSLPIHASLKELMEKVQPLSKADLSQLKWRRKLKDGQVIHVPERKWITIQVGGAVQQPGLMKILSGTRLCELVDQLKVLPEANLKLLCTKKRFLQEGDFVEVPVKKSKR